MSRRTCTSALALLVFLPVLTAKASPGASVILHIDASTVAALEALRKEPKFLNLPGAPAVEERRRLEPLINSLIDRLVAGIQANPSDTWVFGQMTPTVEAFYLEDTEAREPCVDYLARIFKILGIKSDRGAFSRFMISI
ncbi:DUF4844 domain-containing protein [Rhizobacter sp. OV335]|uniref:DUF4844 domain-containing protein n=1 Tax=Rhizobacter sp. OV335 TaxID=1500264 RepID=UPI00091FA906|nr:DUF4844 domain-containing protein [Rhizobacter sp. OV335]SHN38759.1 protein of unknown function [Rhizobacter sp. OV335]SHN39836.1 protein of unknown function [Rhizobacter sp. OV335]